MSDDGRTLDCPNCGYRFYVRPQCPYDAETVAAAEAQIARIETLVSGSNPNVRDAILWLLEDRWQSISGHRLFVKAGIASYYGPLTCDLCHGEVKHGDPIFHLEIRDRWRTSTTILDICKKHIDEQMWEGNMDLHRNQSLKLGLA